MLMKFCIGVFDSNLPKNQEFTGSGFSNSHTVVRAGNEFVNKFSYFLTCLASVLPTDLHKMSLWYYEFHGRKHAEGRTGNLPSTFCTFRVIWMDFSMKYTDSFVIIGALKDTLYLGVNEFLFVIFRLPVLQEICTQCCLGSVS